MVTAIGKASISLAQTGSMPLRTAAKGKPPMPSNRLPIVIFLSGASGLFSSFLIFSPLFQKNFFSRPLPSVQLGKAGNFFRIFPLYLQKVHNLSVKKGDFCEKFSQKSPSNRSVRVQVLPGRKNISRFHIKKWAAKNPETVEVSGFFGWISFSDPQHGARGGT